MAIPFRSNISVGTIFGEGNNLQLSHSNIRVNAGSNLNLSAGNSFNVTVNHDSHLTGEDLYFVGNRKCYLGYGGNQYTNLTLSSDGVVLLAKNLKIRIGETSSTGQGYLYCSSSDGTIITKTMPFGVQTVSDSDSTTSNTGSLSFDFYENDHTYQQMLELKYT